jgi:hypothetical protein
MFPTSEPSNAAFRSYSPGPHAGVNPDPDAQLAPDTIDARARSALTLGVLSLFLGLVTGIPAIWMGRRALAHIEAADGDLKGRWAAWTGIALGGIGVVGTVALWLYLHTRS